VTAGNNLNPVGRKIEKPSLVVMARGLMINGQLANG